MRRSQRPNRRRKRRAERIRTEVEWLDLPLVLHSGGEPPASAGAFRGLPPGLYAFGPGAGAPVAVDRRRITDAALVLSRSERFPEALPPLVGDPDAWRESRREVLRARTRLHSALDPGARDPLVVLEVLEAATWMGPPAIDLLRGLDPDRVARRLAETAGKGPGSRAGAVLLGRVRPRAAVPDAVRPWLLAGERLRAWPDSLLCRLPDAATAAALARLAGADPRVDDPAAARLLDEYVLAAGAFPAPAEISAISDALDAWEEFPREVDRRRGAVLDAANASAGRGRRDETLAARLRAACDRWGLGHPGCTEDALRRLLGTSLYAADLARPDALRGAVPAPPASRRLDLLERTGRLAGRAASFPSIRPLARFLVAVAGRVPPGPDGDGAPACALEVLDDCLARLPPDPAAAAAGLEALDRHAAEILWSGDRAPGGPRGLPGNVVRAARIPGPPFWLSPAETSRVLGGDLCRRLAEFLPDRAREGAAFVRFLVEIDPAGAFGDQAVGAILEVHRLRAPALVGLVRETWRRAAAREKAEWDCAGDLALIVAGFAGKDAARIRFLADHPWLLDEIVRSASRTRRRAGKTDLGSLVWRRAGLLELCRGIAARDGDGPRRAAAFLLADLEKRERRAIARGEPLPPSWEAVDATRAAFLIDLSEGDPASLALFLAHESGSWGSAWDEAARAWPHVAPHADLAAFLRRMAGDGETLPAVLALLRRAAVAVRLRRDAALADLATPEPEGDLPPPPPGAAGLSDALVLDLRRLLAAAGPELPAAVRRILERPRRLDQEAQNLRRRAAEGGLPVPARARLAKIEGRLADPEQLRDRLERDLGAAVSHRLRLFRLARLGRRIDGIVGGFWDEVVGTPRPVHPESDAALELCLCVSRNRRLLRRLLRALADGRDLAAEHPANREFLAALAAKGFRPERFAAPRERSRRVGPDTWTAYVERDPLRIFRMGSLFGTCLSVGEMNDFSVVANAVEANKLVLYVRNAAGQIIGRRLLAVRADGVLFGFRTYGAGGNPWMKLLLDELSVEIARDAGFRLATPRVLARCEERDGRDLRLFAAWYFDGFEPFDWWAIAEGYGARTAAAEVLRRRLRARPTPDGIDEPTLRAALRLGGAADGPLSAEEAEALARWLPGPGLLASTGGAGHNRGPGGP